MSPPSKRSPERDARFFTALENAHPVSKACRAAGYAVPSVYRWRNEDAEFGKRWADAMVLAGDLLEEEAERRGRDGYDVPVFYAGQVVGQKRRYADTLLLARLKAVLPQRYRERGTAAPQQAAPLRVVIREFTMEDELLALVDQGKFSLDELPPHTRSRLERRRAETSLPAPGDTGGH